MGQVGLFVFASLHSILLATIGLIFLVIRERGTPWGLPRQLGIGFLVSAIASVQIFLGLTQETPLMATSGRALSLIGLALTLDGLADSCRVPLLRLWLAIGTGLMVVVQAVLSLGLGREPAAFGLTNAGYAVYGVLLLWVARALPKADHRIGGVLLVATGIALIANPIIRVVAIAMGVVPIAAPTLFMAIVMVGTIIVAVLLAVTALVLVAERHAAHTAREADRDSLTGLVARRVFDRQSQHEFSRWQRHRQPFALILFDIDHFKQVNDTHGHAVGDEALKLVATIGQTELRPTDLFARIGGDEFVVLCPDTTPEDARVLAGRMLQRLRTTPLMSGAATVSLTGSFGIGGPDSATRSITEVMKRADDAAYTAKRGGRDQVVIFTAVPG